MTRLAQASANLFSLVMTARANAVEPFEYLSYLFEHLPSAETVEAIEALLPWNVKSTLEAQHTRPSRIDRSTRNDYPS
jgi:transposase